MNEARLYYKLENTSNNESKFFYYTGELNKEEKKLISFNKIIDEEEMQNIFAVFKDEKNQLLYHINLVEYLHLLKEYDQLIFYRNKPTNNILLDKEDLRNKILKTIRLKRKFLAWFDKNGYPEPNRN